MLVTSKAINILEEILKEENFHSDIIINISNKLETVARHQNFLNMVEEIGDKQNLENLDHVALSNLQISFDFFINFIVNTYALEIVGKVNNLFSLLKLNCRSKYECRMTFKNFEFSVRIFFNNFLDIEEQGVQPFGKGYGTSLGYVS